MKELNLLLALNDMEDELLLEALAEPPQVRRFRPGVLLAAALMAGLLALTAGAVLTEAGWFQQFFARESGRDLTASQAAVVQTSTREFGQSVTLDGYTLTLESVIADAYNCYIKLKLTGPEGTVLNSEDGYGIRSPKNAQELYRSFCPVSGAEFSGVGSWQQLPDDDPGDNQRQILYRWGLDRRSESNFETEPVWRLLIRDLSEWRMGEEDVILAKGDMRFDITFDRINPAQLHFMEAPMPYTFGLPGREDTVEGTIDSCTLRPMSADLMISGCDEAAGFHVLPVILKDGTRVDMQAFVTGNGSYSYTLDAPIDLDAVDHILLPNGTKLHPIDGDDNGK